MLTFTSAMRSPCTWAVMMASCHGRMLPLAVKVRAHLSSRSAVVRTVSAGRLTAGAACSALALPVPIIQAAPPARANPARAIMATGCLRLMFVMLIAFLPFKTFLCCTRVPTCRFCSLLRPPDYCATLAFGVDQRDAITHQSFHHRLARLLSVDQVRSKIVDRRAPVEIHRRQTEQRKSQPVHFNIRLLHAEF